MQDDEMLFFDGAPPPKLTLPWLAAALLAAVALAALIGPSNAFLSSIVAYAAFLHVHKQATERAGFLYVREDRVIVVTFADTFDWPLVALKVRDRIHFDGRYTLELRSGDAKLFLVHSDEHRVRVRDLLREKRIDAMLDMLPPEGVAICDFD